MGGDNYYNDGKMMSAYIIRPIRCIFWGNVYACYYAVVNKCVVASMAEYSDSDFSLGDFEDQNNHENGENGSEHESGIDGNEHVNGDDENEYELDSDLEDLENLLQGARLLITFDLAQAPEDQELPPDIEYGWTNEDTPPLHLPYTATPGLSAELPEDPQPIDCFYLFFDREMWGLLVQETNRYTASRIENGGLKPFSRLRKWTPVTEDEMKVFLALLMTIGLVKKNDLEAYWTKEECIQTPFFSKNMSKDRLLAILSNIHLADNSAAIPQGQPGFDKLFKLRPFIKMCRENFMKYTPERELSFDEGTCPFKGRMHFKVYNPQKPNKFGIKLFELCEAKSGYIVDFDIYQGFTEACSFVDALESMDEDGQPTNHYGDLTTTSKLILGSLVRAGLLNKGHFIFMDNYFTSPELFAELNAMDTYACGTLRVNRKNVPKAFRSVKLRQGGTIFRRSENMLAIKYRDKRDVHILSTIHHPAGTVRTMYVHCTYIVPTVRTMYVHCTYIACWAGKNGCYRQD